MKERLLQCCAVLAILVNFAYAEPVGTCPEENEEYVTFLTDSDDCRIFYKCNWGVSYQYVCPDELYFNSELNVCDYPEQTDCGTPGKDNTGGGDGDDAEQSIEADGEEGDDGTSAVGECPADNDGDTIHLPHESDCTLFYKCDLGVPVLQECPDGLHFNPSLEVCDWPEDAGCESGTGDNDADNGDAEDNENNGNEDGEGNGNDEDNGNDASQPVDASDNEDGEDNGDAEDNEGGNGGDDGSSAVGECPTNNDGDAVHLPHESDCTLYYECDWGVPVLQECPDDLHFNPTKEVCDWPEDAGCESGTGDNDADNGGDEDDENNGNEDGEGNGDDEDNGNDGINVDASDNGDGEDNVDAEDNEGVNGGDDGSSAVGECPANNDGDAVHLPHESDCTLYYECDWGVPVLQECPDDLHFNPSLEVCDWSEDAGCESGKGENDADNGDAGYSENNGNGDGESNGDDGDNGNDGSNVDASDTADDEDNGDAEDNEGGNGGDDGSSAVGECPADNDGDAVHLPHESDCTLYYECDWGVPVLQECPDGLHFNPSLEVCDLPEDAGCESGTGDNDAGNGDAEDDENNGNEDGEGNGDDEDSGNDGTNLDASDNEDTEDNVEGEDNEGANGGDDGSSAVGACPTNNDGDAVHLRHETDCTLYYKCDWGVPVLQECPDGLHFNPSLEVCDWSEAAGCESGTGDNDADNGDAEDNENNGNEDGEGNEDDEDNGNDGTNVDASDNENGEDNVEAEDNEGVNGGDDGSNAVGECPTNNDGDAVHLRHETDCTLFYKCDWGVPVLQECPDGLHFNPSLEVCDWPEAAGCESGAGDNDADNGDAEDDENNGNEDGGSNGDDGDNGNDGGNMDASDNADDEDNVDAEDNGGVNAGDDGSSAVGECPANDDGDAVHLPHESDCTLFYKCDWGVPVLQECPDGLHFNPSLEVCDWPEYADCESGTGDNYADNGDAEDDENNGNEDGESNGDDGDNGNDGSNMDASDNADDEDNGDAEDNDGGNGGDDGSSVVGECPADNDGAAVHLPHQSDCTLYYECDWGVPVLQECPDDLHFNPTKEVCDWPEDAGCESGGGENGDSADNVEGGDNGDGDENGVTEDNNDSDNDGIAGGDDDSDNQSFSDGSDGVSGFCDTLSCPEENEEYVTFISNPTDCTKFCKCNWGLAYEFVCPADLYFNPTINVCDYPEDSGCANSK